MDGCSLDLTVSALACAIAKGKTAEEIRILAVLFTQLGDCLATIESGNELCIDKTEKNITQIDLS